jgi:multidrug efflux pump subunit AcrA (membrane-fusion protein)
MRRWPVLTAAAVFVLAAGCRKGGVEPSPAADAGDAPRGTPVRVALVSTADLAEVVTGPGRTVAIVRQQVRVPFASTLVELRVTDGDTVRKGDVLGSIVSRESEAALAGAREMAREARKPAEKSDAARALQLAERNLVRLPLVSAVDGVVISHAASPGDRLSEGQEVLTLSAADSIVFVADVAQGDVTRVRPGEPVTIAFVGRTRTVPGRVHDALPAANPADLTVPVRIDFDAKDLRLPVGLFGTARVLVGERRSVTVVPREAVLRDDVTGSTRIATVTPGGKAHWIDVRTGLSDGAVTEILDHALAVKQAVIVSGQAGLPEGAAVVVPP